MRCALLILFSLPLSVLAQPNCNVYKINGDESCYKACVLATEDADKAGQGYKRSQEYFDEAIALCPTFDYAVQQKSVPYLKRGEFVTWKKIIDQAVALNPNETLGYRGWCRYQFIRDYRGAIADLELLDSIRSYDIGYSVNGDYHLTFAKALCYKAIGEKEKALQIMEQHLSQKDYYPMPYDYLHIGVLKMEMGDLKGGMEYLKKSAAYNKYLADSYYYLALAYKKQNLKAEALENLEQAKAYYIKGYKRLDPYTHPMDKVYLVQIEKELADLQ